MAFLTFPGKEVQFWCDGQLVSLPLGAGQICLWLHTSLWADVSEGPKRV